MKKLILLLALSLTICGKSFGWGRTGVGGDSDYNGNTCDSYGESYAWVYGISNCITWYCVADEDKWTYAGCDTCEDGYGAYIAGTAYGYDDDVMDIFGCVKDSCAPSVSCSIDDGSGTRYLESETPSCRYGECTVIRCDPGRYKDGNSCTGCPTNTNGLGFDILSKNGGMNGVSDCYITGTAIDASGTLEISGTDCTY